jgi:hypothetical protein
VFRRGVILARRGVIVARRGVIVARRDVEVNAPLLHGDGGVLAVLG